MVRYNSKIGFEVIILLLIIFGLVVMVALFQMSLIVMPIIAVFIGITLAVIQQTYYTIDGNILNVKSWFIINENIEINKITKILETNDPFRSPALSLDRLGIYYNRESLILISPEDKKGFIEHILSINPKVEVKYKQKK